MVLLDISATGEENLIEQQSGNQMNDLEYRRKQLLKLQDAVIDLEDLSTGVSIADLTLNDFRIDLAELPQGAPGPPGAPAPRDLRRHDHAGRRRHRHPAGRRSSACAPSGETAARGRRARLSARPALPRARRRRRRGAPAVHPGQAGARPPQAALPSAATCPTPAPALASTGRPATARTWTRSRSSWPQAVASVVGKKEERAVASLFTPGGTHAMKGEFAGINDFEVVAFLVVLPEGPAS